MPRLPRSPRAADPGTQVALVDAEVGFALSRLAARWENECDVALEPLGISRTQWVVLVSLHRAEVEAQDAVSQRAISRAAQLDEMTISRVMRTLESKGWIDRGPDGLDARAWRVVLTTAGKNQLDRAVRAIRTVNRAFFARDEVRTALRSLAGVR